MKFDSRLIKFEVAGDFACWARSDCAQPYSYVVPTYSGFVGICESIARLVQAKIVPCAVAMCNLPQFDSYAFNCRNDARKRSQIINGSALQVWATVLRDVRYKLYAKIEMNEPNELWSEQVLRHNENSVHAYQDIFYRRLRKKQSWDNVHLGWREFGVNYCGFLTDTPIVPYFEDIPKMLKTRFDGLGEVNPTFFDAKVENGVLLYFPDVNLTDWE